MSKKRNVAKSCTGKISVLFMLILVTIVSLASSNIAKAEEWECPPNDYGYGPGEEWQNGGDANIVQFGNSACFILYKYCWRLVNGALEVYIGEMAKAGNPSCFDSLDMIAHYTFFINMCIKDILQKRPEFIIFDCDYHTNAVVRVGHPSCVTDPYDQEIIKKTYQQQQDWTVGSKWGLAATASTIAQVAAIAPTNSEDINANNLTNSTMMVEPKGVPNGRVWIKVVSPCGTVYPEDICWTNKYYCWDENGDEKSWEVTETMLGSTCPTPSGRYVYAIQDINMPSKYWRQKWVNCNFNCVQGD